MSKLIFAVTLLLASSVFATGPLGFEVDRKFEASTPKSFEAARNYCSEDPGYWIPPVQLFQSLKEQGRLEPFNYWFWSGTLVSDAECTAEEGVCLYQYNPYREETRVAARSDATGYGYCISLRGTTIR